VKHDSHSIILFAGPDGLERVTCLPRKVHMQADESTQLSNLVIKFLKNKMYTDHCQQ
jgi:hypothetical protein